MIQNRIFRVINNSLRRKIRINKENIRYIQEIKRVAQQSTEYDRGFYNGLELALAVLEDRLPDLKTKKEVQ